MEYYSSESYKECKDGHTKIVQSPYPKEKVPIELFREDPTDPNSKIWNNCFHCRVYKRESKKRNLEIRKEKAKLSKEKP